MTSEYNDVFGLYLDGVNIGVVPGSDPPAPITINTINPFSHPSFYINNVGNNLGLDGAVRNVEYDGFTTVITAQYLDLPPGIHHMKIAVADASDGILDAAVFIEASSFTAAELSVTGPAELAVSGHVGNPNPFTVTAYLHNKTAFPISGDSLTLVLSGTGGLALAGGATATHGPLSVAPGETVQTAWQVQATFAGTWEYRVQDALNPDLVAAQSIFVPDVTAECQPGAIQSCETGQVGACSAGMRICGVDGLWGGCFGTAPAVEICTDGWDNDCDGAADRDDSDCGSKELDCNSARPSPAVLWSPKNKVIPVTIGGIENADGLPVVITIDAITQDETVNRKQGADASGVGTSIAHLRADRLGNGNGGRVYVIEFSAEGQNGSSCQGKVSVCVPHDMARPVCFDDGQNYDSSLTP